MGIQCRHPSPSAPGTIHLLLRPAAGHPLGQARRGGGQGLALREGTVGTAWGTCRGGWPCSGRWCCRVSGVLGSWARGCPMAGGFWVLSMGSVGGDGGRVQAAHKCPQGCILGIAWQSPVTEHPLRFCLGCATQGRVPARAVCMCVSVCAQCHCVCVCLPVCTVTLHL